MGTGVNHVNNKQNGSRCCIYPSTTYHWTTTSSHVSNNTTPYEWTTKKGLQCNLENVHACVSQQNGIVELCFADLKTDITVRVKYDDKIFDSILLSSMGRATAFEMSAIWSRSLSPSQWLVSYVRDCYNISGKLNSSIQVLTLLPEHLSQTMKLFFSGHKDNHVIVWRNKKPNNSNENVFGRAVSAETHERRDRASKSVFNRLSELVDR